MTTILKTLVIGVALAAMQVLAAPMAVAETKVGSTVESRVLLGFKANDAAVTGLLPEGWTAITLPRGPVGGANLLLVLMDKHAVLDAEGQPANAAVGPNAAFVAYGRKEGVEGVRTFVTRVYEGAPIEDPYGNSVAANIERVAGHFDAGGTVRRQSENWTVQLAAGGSLTLELEAAIGRFNWAAGSESRPYSSANPDFYRIYRFDQLAGLAMNAAMGVELKGAVDFASDDPAMAEVFDGSEALVAIITVPSVVREIWLP